MDTHNKPQQESCAFIQRVQVALVQSVFTFVKLSASTIL